MRRWGDARGSVGGRASREEAKAERHGRALLNLSRSAVAILLFIAAGALVSIAIAETRTPASNAYTYGYGYAYQYQYDTAHLIVIKHVVKDNGGTAVASDFTMQI